MFTLRVLALSTALAFLLGTVAVVLASEPRTLEGVVVSSGQETLTMKDADAKQHSFKADVMTKVTFNGKPGKLEDFQAGMPVRVTVGEESRLLAVSTIDDKKLAANY
jgi:hypothetical protein